jgi:uncharacterized Zn finger protein
MIILKCKNCGNSNLVNGQYDWSFTCQDCGKVIELWEVTYQQQSKELVEQPKNAMQLGAT